MYPNTTYPALAAVLGTTYGGDSTHFAVPDLKGRVPIGAGAGAGLTNRALGQKLGEENHLNIWQESGTNGNGATGTENANHAHYVPGQTANGGTNAVSATGGQNAATHPGDINSAGYASGSKVGPHGPGEPADWGPNNATHSHAVSVTVNAVGTGIENAPHAHALAARDADWAHNNIQPSIGLNYIIRAR